MAGEEETLRAEVIRLGVIVAQHSVQLGAQTVEVTQNHAYVMTEFERLRAAVASSARDNAEIRRFIGGDPTIGDPGALADLRTDVASVRTDVASLKVAIPTMISEGLKTAQLSKSAETALVIRNFIIAVAVIVTAAFIAYKAGIV